MATFAPSIEEVNSRSKVGALKPSLIYDITPQKKEHGLMLLFICVGANAKTTSIRHSEWRIPENFDSAIRNGAPFGTAVQTLPQYRANSTMHTVPRTQGSHNTTAQPRATRLRGGTRLCIALVFAVAIATAGDMRFLVSRSMPVSCDCADAFVARCAQRRESDL